MKKYEGNMKKYKKNKKDSPYIEAVGLGKIPSSSSYLWVRRERGDGGGAGSISRFRDTPEK